MPSDLDLAGPLREALLAAPDRVADVAAHHLSRERFDLTWLTFSASHLAGHQFWDLSQLDEGNNAAAAPQDDAARS